MVKKFKKINKVALFSSKFNKNTLKITSQIEEVLKNIGIKVFFSRSFSSKGIAKGKIFSDMHIIKNSDLLIAVGGDGTLLSSARIFGSEGWWWLWHF